MNKKKLLSLCLVLCLGAIALVGGSLAYFTDADEEENVFTVGNVDIEIVESKLHRQVDNATDEQILADSKTYQDYLADEGANMVPGRWVRKAPYINNVGNNPAFVRVIVEQSKWFWENTSMMEYTTAQQEGAIVRSDPVETQDGKMRVTYTFTEALEPGELSKYCPIWQFKINEDVTSDDLLTRVDDEEIVMVYAEAIQAEGFADYEAAFAAYDAQK